METDNKEILEKLPETLIITSEEKKANVLDDNDDDFLGLLKKKKNKKKNLKTMIILVICVAIIGTAATFTIKHFLGSSSTVETVYRESTVSQGNITVGLTESSSVSLTKENITLPISAEIEEVYVNSGQTVKEGDPLFKYNTDDAEDYLDDYALKIEDASIALQNAQINQKTKLLSAKQTLDISKLESQQAGENKELSLSQLKLALSDAQISFENAEEKLNTLNSDSDTISADIIKLSNYYSDMVYYEELVNDSKDDVSDYQSDSSDTSNEIKELENIMNTLKTYGISSNSSESVNTTIINNYSTAMATAKTALDDAIAADTDTIAIANTQKAYNNAKDTYDTIMALYVNYSTYQNNYLYLAQLNAELGNYSSQSQSSSDNVSTYSEKYENAKEEYNDFKEDFTEKYGNNSTEDDVIDQYVSAQATYTKAQLDVEQQKADNDISTLKADQKYNSAILSGQLAQQTYNITALTLSQSINSAQEAYDQIVKDYDELKSLLSEDGIVRATEPGMVSSVKVLAGDTVEVKAADAQSSSTTYTTIMTITSIADVYVPISITEDDILDVYVGQPASVALSAYSDKKFDAIVDSISIESARVGAATVTYTVTVKFTEENTVNMFEGMTADVTLIEANVDDVIYVSSQSILKEDGISYLFVKDENGEPVKKQVTTGFTDGKNVEIKSGIDINDVIMVESAVGSSDGTSTQQIPTNMFPSGTNSNFGNRKE